MVQDLECIARLLPVELVNSCKLMAIGCCGTICGRLQLQFCGWLCFRGWSLDVEGHCMARLVLCPQVASRMLPLEQEGLKLQHSFGCSRSWCVRRVLNYMHAEPGCTLGSREACGCSRLQGEGGKVMAIGALLLADRTRVRLVPPVCWVCVCICNTYMHGGGYSLLLRV